MTLTKDITKFVGDSISAIHACGGKSSFSEGFCYLGKVKPIYMDLKSTIEDGQKEIAAFKAGEFNEELNKFTALETAIPELTDLAVDCAKVLCSDSAPTDHSEL